MGAEQAFYKDPDTLQKAIDAYFTSCDIEKEVQTLTKRGDVVTYKRKTPYTVIDLALALGFDNRHSLFDYEKRNNGKVWAASIIRRAKGRIEAQRLQMALLGDVDSHIARLDLSSNFGYSEKNVTEHHLIDDRITDEERRLLKDAAKHLAEQRQLAAPRDTIDLDNGGAD